MKIKLVVGGVFAGLLAICCNAQDIQLIRADEVIIALPTGHPNNPDTRYYIQFETSDYDVSPDTLWMGNMPFCLDFSDSLHGLKRTIDKIHHQVTFSLSLAIVGPTSKSIPSKKYDGAAILAYTYKGKQCSFIIKPMQFKKKWAI